MNVDLKDPELEQFIDEQVKSGHFTSREAVVQAAIEQMKIDLSSSTLTPEDIEAIRESDQQIDRGEFVDFDTFASEMRKKYCGK